MEYPYAGIGSLSLYTHEFLVSESISSLLTPISDQISLNSLLPIEGESIPFSISDNKLYCSGYQGYLAQISQSATSINTQFLGEYIGLLVRASMRYDCVIIDGCEIDVDRDGVINIKPGLVLIDRKIYTVAGLLLRIGPEVSTMPEDTGYSFIVYLLADDLELMKGVLVPKILKTDLVVTSIGDYRVPYNVILGDTSVDYRSTRYIELVRGQMINIFAAKPMKKIRISQRMRNSFMSNHII